jgi:hypothetical protein
MRHWSAHLTAILVSAMCAVLSFAADAADCVDCAVANAIASALQKDDRSRFGLHVGDGDWLFSVASPRIRLGIAVDFAEQFIAAPRMQTAIDPSWAVSVRFEIGTR